MAAGVPLEHAVKLSNLAAGLVVAKVGTATVKPSELMHEIQQRTVMENDRKVMDLADAIERVALWRRKGLRVGFTNGCFDLLHPGHITLLNQAKAHCDRLVVGLNSDSSAARVKGAGRPIQDELARSIVLASLSCVDMVVFFSEDTPETLIRALQPMVLVKGADYQPEEVVGADLVTAWGGELVLVDLVPNNSTTKIVRQVRRSFSRPRRLSRTAGAHP
jgi:D-beta-D-heptose 7-phosphate kinase/D-beta-D-heptose 1-phosphate adenosyltransferase